MKTTGYWLYNEELEKFHPTNGRVGGSWSNKELAGASLEEIIRRSHEQYLKQQFSKVESSEE